MPPENHLSIRKGVRKDLRGGFYDDSDFQFGREARREKNLDVYDAETFDMLSNLYLPAIQRIDGNGRRGRKKRRENGIGRDHRHRRSD
jgi:hypothetical protein